MSRRLIEPPRHRALQALVYLTLILLGWAFLRSVNNADRIGILEREHIAQMELTDRLSAQLDAVIELGADVATPEQVAASVPNAEVSPINPETGGRGTLLPVVLEGPPGEAGPPGADATQEQVDASVRMQLPAAIAAWCAERGSCVGPQGVPGSSPSALDVLAIVRSEVVAFCEQNNGCRGPRGDTGAQGERGRPPTSEEILAAHAQWCAANNACRGEQGPPGPEGPPGMSVTGPPGPPGADGAPGREVAGVSCLQDEPGTVVNCDITYIN